MRRLVVMLAGGLLLAAMGLPVAAQAGTGPPNDSFASATVITSVPFSTMEDTSQATSDPTDPGGCWNNGSVWFSFTPSTSMQLEADTFGSGYDTALSAWTGTQGSLNQVACNDDFGGTLQSKVSFTATAGTTYYFMVAVCCGDGGNGGGSLRFSLNQTFAPGNDDFANATPIGALPFSDTRDLSTATGEPGEPSGCFQSANTVWYSFTPSTTRSVMATASPFGVDIAVYTGTSLANLSQVACGGFSGPATFRAQVGTTYFIQAGAVCCEAFGPVTFSLAIAPNPQASFGYYPSDPSSFDAIQFFDDSSDPAGAGISAWAWDFGDGTTSTLQSPTHRYTADGDYTAALTVTTTDGRTGSISQSVQVRTHDVAITRLGVPKSVHVGQTITVTIDVQNTRYPETVEVDLSKSIPNGFTQVGSLTQSVPAKSAGQTTRFEISYTITSDDQAIGKITFQAVATIAGHRDALPADNELLSTLVTVT